MASRESLTDSRNSRAVWYTKQLPEHGWTPVLLVDGVLTLGSAAGSLFVAFESGVAEQQVGTETVIDFSMLSGITIAGAVVGFLCGLFVIVVARYLWAMFWAPSWQRDEARREAHRWRLEVVTRDTHQITVRPEHENGVTERVGIRVHNFGPDGEFSVHVELFGLLGGGVSFYATWDGDGARDMRALPRDGEDIAWIMRRSTWDTEEGSMGYARLQQQRVELQKVGGAEIRRIGDGQALIVEIKVLRRNGNPLPLVYTADFQKDSGNIYLSPVPTATHQLLAESS